MLALTRQRRPANARVPGFLRDPEHRAFVGLAAILMLTMGMQIRCVLYSAPTPDEVAHLPAGLSIWQTGQFDVYKVNPPLVKVIATAPVCLLKPKTDWSHAKAPSAGSRIEFLVGRDFIASNRSRAMDCFQLARIACLPFTVLDIVISFLWGRAIGGSASGLVAALLYAVSPMLSGHGSLITPDAGATAIGLTAFYGFRRWLIESTTDNAVLLGVFAGLGLVTKFTWTVVFPCSTIILIIYWRRSQIRTCWSRDLRHISLASIIAILIVNCAYGFEDSFCPLGEIEFISKTLCPRQPETATVDQGIPQSPLISNRFSGTIFHSIPMPVPATYLRGIDLQKVDFERPTRSYLLGEWRTDGWWYYYVLGYLMKETEVTIGLVIFTLAGAVLRRMTSSIRRNESRSTLAGQPDLDAKPDRVPNALPPAEIVTLMVPATLVFVLVSSQSNMNHHLRYVLPAFPFLQIIASQSLRTLPKFLHLFLFSFLCIQFGCNLVEDGHPLSKFNRVTTLLLQGEPPLLSSNFDWGQDVLELIRWQRENLPDEVLHAAVSTHYDPQDLGLNYRTPAPFRSRFPSVVDEGGRRGPQPGWFAVSKGILMGERFSPWTGPRINSGDLRYLTRLKPVEMVGSTILIFHISDDEAAALRKEMEIEERPALATGQK